MSVILQDAPEVLQADAEYRRFCADPVMRERVRARERFLNDERLKLAGAKREGRAEGKAEKARETAVAMKRKGYPVADIAELTSLPLSEIEQLN